MLNFRYQNLLGAINQEKFFEYIQTLQFTELPFSGILTMLEKLVGLENSEKISYFPSLMSVLPQKCLVTTEFFHHLKFILFINYIV